MLFFCSWQTNTTKKLSKKRLKQLIRNFKIEISRYFTNEELNQLAHETKFVQREGKINGLTFFELIVFHNENLKKQSLNDLSILLEDEFNIDIKKQSLHERFNEHAVQFVKSAFEKLLHDWIVLLTAF